MKPQRIQLSRRKGFKLQAASLELNGLPAVKVDRSTKWGNPFVVGEFGTREECARFFELMLAGNICVSAPHAVCDAQVAYLKMARRDRGHLVGKNLACWCPLPKVGGPDLCHAATLLKMAAQYAKSRAE